MQTICISLQTDNHTNTPSLEFNHTNTPSLEFYRLDALRDTQAVKAQTSITNISEKVEQITTTPHLMASFPRQPE